MLDSILFFSRLITFDLIFNFVLIIIFIFSKNYLEEDLIIGLFSCIILLSLFFCLKGLKAEDIRQLRLNIKKANRIQKNFLISYYFSGIITFNNFFKHIKKHLSNIFFIKLMRNLLFVFFKLISLSSKKIYINNRILKRFCATSGTINVFKNFILI